jgi:DNA-binding NarL/FixJ family response regulator
MKNPDHLSEQYHILLIGNNPIEMGKIIDNIDRVPGKKIITEIAFDIKGSLERLIKFRPNFILIDDNIGRTELAQTVSALSANRKTKNIPITVLKNSNYRESSAPGGILDYMLKQNLSPEVLYSALKNSLKFRRAQLLLYKAYQKRKGQLLRLVTNS